MIGLHVVMIGSVAYMIDRHLVMIGSSANMIGLYLVMIGSTLSIQIKKLPQIIKGNSITILNYNFHFTLA